MSSTTRGVRIVHVTKERGGFRDFEFCGRNGDHSMAALKSIRAARPNGDPVYVILDNVSANKTPRIRCWAAKNNVDLCFTPTSASWANPIEA
ncbi:transposase [Nocardia sp. NPDC049220]|uniref:transposase n=1 Tax=Nocardia sp. NPDC049220 TaxID=3155273 RepID=UPI0033ECDA2F